jgi:hypothetical protein
MSAIAALKRLFAGVRSLSLLCAIISDGGMDGSMPEWLMGADCKSAGYAYAGSNPARPIHSRGMSFEFSVLKQKLLELKIQNSKSNCPCGSVVEHTLGKGEVISSILITGFFLNLAS